jgi:hypothetical protein
VVSGALDRFVKCGHVLCCPSGGGREDPKGSLLLLVGVGLAVVE